MNPINKKRQNEKKTPVKSSSEKGNRIIHSISKLVGLLAEYMKFQLFQFPEVPEYRDLMLCKIKCISYTV